MISKTPGTIWTTICSDDLQVAWNNLLGFVDRYDDNESDYDSHDSEADSQEDWYDTYMAELSVSDNYQENGPARMVKDYIRGRTVRL
jgi:hypothetical protein